MTTAKIAISLPHELLVRVDGQAAETGRSRSEFIRVCVERALDAAEEERLVREARALYAAVGYDDDVELVEAMTALAAETLPPWEAEDAPPTTKRAS
jgi:metal-responsive CopG/Arc/MetJ family transcriptional regulator